MQTTPLKPSDRSMSSLVKRIDPIKLLLVAILAALALVVWSIGRNGVVEPLDNLLTERLCRDHGEEINRESIGYERSNRFGLFNRSEGYCSYGEGPDGEAPITLTIEDTAPGPLYRGAKWIGIIIQLGIVSIFLRLTVEPVLESYRYLRERFG